MRYAIIESGGKQYRAVEGLTVEVDRLPAAPGAKIDLERILFMADGDEVLVGTPTLSGVQVKATVVDHIRGPKVITYKYRPKKRIRVKGGHRQQYTRLMVDFIGKPGEVRKKAEKAEEAAVKKVEKARVEARPKAEKPAKGPKVEPKKAAPKTPAKTEKAPPAKKPAAKAPARTEKTPATSSPKGKKPAADKSSSKRKKSTTTRKSNK